jgi:hypothetical protein
MKISHPPGFLPSYKFRNITIRNMSIVMQSYRQIFLMEGDIVLTEEQKCHRLAFYEAALTNFLTKGRNERLMMKDKYSVIKEACLRLHNGETASALKRAGFGNIHSWRKKFGILVAGEHKVLVSKESTSSASTSGNNNDMDNIRRPTYMERVYNDILKHHADHKKGVTLHKKVGKKFSNISRDWTIELIPDNNHSLMIAGSKRTATVLKWLPTVLK